MKKISITVKVTLWYTLFMSIILFTSFIFVDLFSNNSLRMQTEKQIKEIVTSSSENIVFENGYLNIDKSIDKNNNGVLLSVYDIYGNLLKGSVPRTFNIDTPFSEGEIVRFDSPNGLSYFYYDDLVNVNGYGDLWVRGITSYSDTQQALNNVTTVFFVVMPLAILLILTGGYFVTKKALKPVEDIRKAAQSISVGEDLNMRLAMTKSNDEIYRLAETFDSMFERLQISFEREKQFTSDISHELRTPLAIILLQAEDLLKEPSLSIAQIEKIERIRIQATKVSRLIAQMLTLSRTEESKIALEHEEINLFELVDILEEENQNFAMEKRIALLNDIPKESMVWADRGMLIRILGNLISNAIAYGKEDGFVKVEYLEKEESSLIVVEDDGIGIKPEHINKIWHRFYRVDNSRKEMGDTSSGLGLSMVSWMVKQLGWEIEVESEFTKGSKFIIKIPK